ncbi:MAG: D-alanyl-D-alanine carboxypeptidase [Spirochaetes bacterium]|nr:D-alanyl-D-alanine carboxypeptidase [Spirochaetota bacterium]
MRWRWFNIPVVIYIFFPFALGANPASLPSPPTVTSLAAILMDATTGTILYEKNADLPHPPASLTKVVTIHILLDKIKKGEFSWQTPVPLPPETWASHQPSDSSLMFLGPNQRATVQDILQGLAVASGNDAAIAAALFVSGSVSAFAQRMNQEVERLGLKNLYFVEPSGYDASNRITARDFALFLKFYLEAHPESLNTLHSLREFTYPRPENVENGQKVRPITQFNKNSLVYTYPWADGIKTGFLYESGFNLAATAKKNGTRLLVVILGTTSSNLRKAIQIRNDEAVRLLEYGFTHFMTWEVPVPPLSSIRVWKGSTLSFTPTVPSSLPVTVRKGREAHIRVQCTQSFFIEAPVQPNTVIGTLRIYDGSTILKEGNLLAGVEIPRGSWFQIVKDTLIVFFRKLFRMPV